MILSSVSQIGDVQRNAAKVESMTSKSVLVLSHGYPRAQAGQSFELTGTGPVYSQAVSTF